MVCLIYKIIMLYAIIYYAQYKCLYTLSFVVEDSSMNMGLSSDADEDYQRRMMTE